MIKTSSRFGCQKAFAELGIGRADLGPVSPGWVWDAKDIVRPKVLVPGEAVSVDRTCIQMITATMNSTEGPRHGKSRHDIPRWTRGLRRCARLFFKLRRCARVSSDFCVLHEFIESGPLYTDQVAPSDKRGRGSPFQQWTNILPRTYTKEGVSSLCEVTHAVCAID